MPQGGRSVTINFYWVKGAFKTTLTALLDNSVPDIAAIEAEQYTEFDSKTAVLLYMRTIENGVRD